MTDIQRPTVPDELLVARARAIDLSGWQRPFVLLQPRNLAFWVYALLVGAGIAGFIDLVGGYDSTSVISAVVVFSIYAAVFWWLTQRADRYTELPAKLMIAALLWGGFAATWAMAAVANSALGDLYGKELGQRWALDWSAGLSAPVTEELAKGAGLLLLIALARRIIRTAFDGFIVGLLIGLGFQILEDVSYALRDAPAMGSTIVLRMVTGISGHFAYSAIFCAGLVYLLGRPAEPRNIRRGVVLVVTAPVLHGLWDSAGTIVGGNVLLLLLLWLFIVVITLTVFGRVFALTVPRERALLRDVMAPEAAAGVLTAAELDAMTGNRKARRAYRKAHRRPRRQRRHAAQILDAAYDLARERGAETGRVQFARAEISRIRNHEPSPW
ncbi:hypothetical protein A5740_24150 [Mycobacterium sp. GA-1841]|uniref:PrsW family intramembrane metalloprotease n=1 Tax=Mycobacterium sp. GA-1841 TaxID=1834154 RepID=UPI00096F10BA|nr:PrsW family glutamic-type intramembrane protease [Mycobacterium sp. GA-1841]OMC40699.1 hypothetical protein A5740_24150 [Mycobacterium sp. GA-1841]